MVRPKKDTGKPSTSSQSLNVLVAQARARKAAKQAAVALDSGDEEVIEEELPRRSPRKKAPAKKSKSPAKKSKSPAKKSKPTAKKSKAAVAPESDDEEVIEEELPRRSPRKRAPAKAKKPKSPAKKSKSPAKKSKPKRRRDPSPSGSEDTRGPSPYREVEEDSGEDQEAEELGDDDLPDLPDPKAGTRGRGTKRRRVGDKWVRVVARGAQRNRCPLTVEQEDAMYEWLKSNHDVPCLSHENHVNRTSKLAAQAEALNEAFGTSYTGAQLNSWLETRRKDLTYVIGIKNRSGEKDFDVDKAEGISEIRKRAFKGLNFLEGKITLKSSHQTPVSVSMIFF